MPFQYAHVEFGTDPRQALQRIVRNAEYLLKSAQKCLADNVTQEYLASQGEVETHNNRQLRVWNLIEMKDDFNELSRWIDKVKVVELKTPADEWEEFAVSQRPLYTKEAIQKLPDDIIRYVAEYLEDDLSITIRMPCSVFYTHVFKSDIKRQFIGDVQLGTADWSGNALKFLWLKHVVPKIKLDCDFHNSKDLRKALIKSLLKWDKFRLRDNIMCLINCDPITFGYRWGGKIEMITKDNKLNIFSNKAIHHLIKTINWMNKTMTKEKLKRFRCPHLKKVDELVETIGNCIPEMMLGDEIKPVIPLHFCVIPLMEQEQRRKWVDEYNNSLPQKKWFDAEFDEEMTIAIGGIYDSEYTNFVFDNYPSPRILKLLGY